MEPQEGSMSDVSVAGCELLTMSLSLSLSLKAEGGGGINIQVDRVPEPVPRYRCESLLT